MNPHCLEKSDMNWSQLSRCVDKGRPRKIGTVRNRPVTTTAQILRALFMLSQLPQQSLKASGTFAGTYTSGLVVRMRPRSSQTLPPEHFSTHTILAGQKGQCIPSCNFTTFAAPSAPKISYARRTLFAFTKTKTHTPRRHIICHSIQPEL